MIVGINFDEISDDLDEAIACIRRKGLQHAELRTVNGKNFCFWDDEEIAAFNEAIAAAELTVVAASSPLFKWYQQPDDPEIKHDSFGFDPRQNEETKRETIVRTLENAVSLGVSRVRIFSELGERDDAGRSFAQSELLAFALDEADKRSVDLYLENEPVCTVHTLSEYAALFRVNLHPRLKMWVDVANFEQVGDAVSEDFVREFADRIGYVHVKDYIKQHGGLRYVPAGQGEVDYVSFFKLMDTYVNREIIATVETHATEDKIVMSEASIDGVRNAIAQAKGDK